MSSRQPTLAVNPHEQVVIKSQVKDTAPKRIKSLQFGILSQQDAVQQSVVEVSDRHPYEHYTWNSTVRPITKDGPLDPRMGCSTNSTRCETCNKPLKSCNGHFGHVRLALPCWHIGYFSKVIEVLHCICKECSTVLLDRESYNKYLLLLQRPGLENNEKKAICKKIIVECRKCKECPKCRTVIGPVKKVQGHPLKIYHDKFQRYNTPSAKAKEPPKSKIRFEQSFETAIADNPEIGKHYKKAADDLHPLRVLRLFQRVDNPDCYLLGMNPNKCRPEMLIWQYVPAPPACIRPTVAQDSATTEDDITNKLADIVACSNAIRQDIMTGVGIQKIMEKWDHLQFQVAVYINSEGPSLRDSNIKSMRGFCQRLKGKQGRFRGNLSGKRVDFSGRTVISPDPNLAIDEVGIPERVASNLTYPEKVHSQNIKYLRRCVERGSHYPGANFVFKKRNGARNNLSFLTVRLPHLLKENADNLEIGDVVARHLRDGDIVLFNRQPSLHKLSIMCHKVKVHQSRTFRLNECVCTPYNADFDGDEMNLHVPQTEEARAEALELMGIRHNLLTPKDGTPIIAATQDFITAAYLLSNKDRFYNRAQFCQICSDMLDANAVGDPVSKKNTGSVRFQKIHVPEPAILKPQKLWTGKQVFNVLMKPSIESKVLVNLDAACKEHKGEPDKAPELSGNDTWLCIRNSEIMCGVLDKNTLGSGKKGSIFYVLLRDYGPDCAVQAMNRLARLSARWLTTHGFSIGIDDVYAGKQLIEKKDVLIKEAYQKCDELIKDFNRGTLRRDAGCNQEVTLENKISGILNEVRQKAGALCFEHLSPANSAIIMAASGAKGSPINVSQMVAAVGQQSINNSRVADGFQDRTLPHFPKAARQPPSKGFVQNSFFSGLSPTEFLFHAMSGREGLVDTAVKTAETGYMSRRLMKSLEDLSVNYDTSVRNSTSGIVQFKYGEDGLDPVDMEGKAQPVDFDRAFLHAQTSKWSKEESTLLPNQIAQITQDFLEERKHAYARKSLKGDSLAYNDQSPMAIDQYESMRNFLTDIEKFVEKKSSGLAKLRSRFDLPDTAGESDEMDIYNTMESALNLSSTYKLSNFYTDTPNFASDLSQIVKMANDIKNKVAIANGVDKISKASLSKFLKLCLLKYDKARVEPAHAVGAVGAQSIGEPGTQMTLKTFHFAGVAGMSITQGVPRIKEIINGSKKISTPLITCPLISKYDETAARTAKSQIEKTYLKDIMKADNELWTPSKGEILLYIDLNAAEDLCLGIDMLQIRQIIIKARGLKLTKDNVKIKKGNVIAITPDAPETKTSRGKKAKADAKADPFLQLQQLRRQVPDLTIRGYPDANRAVISKTGSKREVVDQRTGEVIEEEEKQLLVEGYGFRACMTTPGIDGYRTVTNNIFEIFSVLGVEAARFGIIRELHNVIGEQMDIDPRHMQLLADVMTSKGEILGITRFGMSKMRDSVLQLASFEKTSDHLFEAAVSGKEDPIDGVSESIIMGQPMKLGTGAMSIVKGLSFTDEDFKPKPTIFEDWCGPDGDSRDDSDY